MRGLIIVASSLLAACVSAETHMLDSRTAIISSRGTGLDSPADVATKVLQRAATEAQARGYPYFQIVGFQDMSRSGTYTTPGTARTNAYGQANCYSYTCYGTASSTTTYNPGQTFQTFAPGADVTVRFLHASEITKDMTGIWEAASVLAQQK